MDNKNLELFQAIQSIIDPLKDDMQSMKDDMQDMKNDMQVVKERLTNVENDLSDVKEEVRRTNITIENEIRKNIQILVEGHQGLKDRLWHLPDEVDK